MKLQNNKYTMLFLSLVFDGIGLLSFSLFGLGEFSDIIWAPISAYLIAKLYKGRAGKVGAAVSFVEEALPFLDVIPTFTIMWVYTYVIKSEQNTAKPEV